MDLATVPIFGQVCVGIKMQILRFLFSSLILMFAVMVPVSLFAQTPIDRLTGLATLKREPVELGLLAPYVMEGPQIDGIADDLVWEQAQEIQTLDFASQREIRLRSVHTEDQIFLMVQYPVAKPSVKHRSYQWSITEQIYKPTNDREDCLILKWSKTSLLVDLALRNGHSHSADVWFWKACRTNSAGYADDKYQLFTSESGKYSQAVTALDGTILHLQRIGDAGQSAYREELIFEYVGDLVSRYQIREPQGSRADVRARGTWSYGTWTIEFSRKLKTGHEDDLAMEIGESYLFGVSCFEIAGGEVDSSLTQPLYKTGDTFDRLILQLLLRGD